MITVAAAGTLTLATAISAAAAMLPSGTAAAPASAADAFLTVGNGHQSATRVTRASDARSAAQGMAQFDRVRMILGERQRAHELAAAKAAAAKAAAKAAAARAAAAKAAAAKAAASAAAKQAAAAKPTATAQATPAVAVQSAVSSGSPQQIAEQMLSQFGWSSSEFSCLQPLWERESGWSVTAENPSSGAFGIPQAMPGSQMASAGADWQTNAATQIRWGLTYIKDRYGSPCGAWGHEESDGWY